MENMLKKIIVADKTAQETVEKSEEQRRNVEEKILQAKEQFEIRYSEETEAKLDELRKEKQKILEEEKEKNKQATQEQLDRLEKICEENMEQWVKSIVERVIG
ncbi:MAG: hypothetical protein IKA56_05340 [Clostridia bacterium]|nr:hypothetical protein [Clostridia bacterium]